MIIHFTLRINFPWLRRPNESLVVFRTKAEAMAYRAHLNEMISDSRVRIELKPTLKRITHTWDKVSKSIITVRPYDLRG